MTSLFSFTILYFIILYNSFICIINKGLRRESNPGHLHPKQVFYLWTTKPLLILFFFINFSHSPIYIFRIRKKRAQSDSNQWPRELQSYALPLSYAPSYYYFIFFLDFPSPQLFFFIKTPPVGLEPTTLRLKAARSTDWARKALDITSTSVFTI